MQKLITGERGVMKIFIKKYWKTLVFFLLSGLIGGFFTGLYTLDIYPPEIQQEILSQGINSTTLAIASAIQAAVYGLILGALGIFLGKKTGLWKDESTFTKKPLIAALIVSLLGGMVLILPDLLFFGKYSEVIMDSYAAKPNFIYIIAAVIYGGVIEEVMLRLFMMTLAAFILHIIFERKKQEYSKGILTTANIIAALLFAAGHLPATAAMMELTPMIIFRCFLLNGGFGLLFGRLYRKYGLRYSMLAHAGCHIVSKLIWILFV